MPSCYSANTFIKYYALGTATFIMRMTIRLPLKTHTAKLRSTMRAFLLYSISNIFLAISAPAFIYTCVRTVGKSFRQCCVSSVYSYWVSVVWQNKLHQLITCSESSATQTNCSMATIYCLALPIVVDFFTDKRQWMQNWQAKLDFQLINTGFTWLLPIVAKPFAFEWNSGLFKSIPLLSRLEFQSQPVREYDSVLLLKAASSLKRKSKVFLRPAYSSIDYIF